jgi:hypothetical protein
MDRPTDLITTAQARMLLGVSTKKMADMLRDGTIRHFPDVLDRRKKLVSKGEVLALRAPRAEAA